MEKSRAEDGVVEVSGHVGYLCISSCISALRDYYVR